MSALLIGALIISSIAVVLMPYAGLRRSVERRIFWCMVPAVSVAGALSTYPTWDHATLFAVFPVLVMMFGAWAYTPYIKIGGTIYALNLKDRRPDPEDETDRDINSGSAYNQLDFDEEDDAATDFGEAPVKYHAATDFDSAANSYSGMLTPGTMWWVMVGLSVIAAGNIYAYIFSDGKAPVAIVMAVFVGLLALGTGYGDASWGYRIARGQPHPFILASLVTAGGFAITYLAAYYTARRWPPRRAQSKEHRAHPRHQKRER